MSKPSEYVTELFKKLREDIAEIKHRLFTEKPNLESSEHPKEYSVDAVHTNPNANKEADIPQSAVVRARLNLPETIRVKAETEERTKPWREDRNLLLQTATIVVGIVVAIIYGRQLDVMSGQLKVMQKDQRPQVIVADYVIMDPGGKGKKESQEFEIGKPLVVNVQFRNVGRSLALILHLHYHLLFGQKIAQLRSEAPDTGVSPGNILGPTSEGTVTAISVVDTYSKETIHTDPSQVVNWDGTEPIIVFGRVVYKDADGKLYCTPFLAKHLPHNWAIMPSPEGIVLCPEGEP